MVIIHTEYVNKKQIW